MSRPKRIQRKRGVKLPDGARYVGRPTRWGNPFKVVGPSLLVYAVLASFGSHGVVQSAQAAADLYHWWLLHTDEGRFTARNASRELRGRDLACWCPLDQPCHADVLLEIANP